MRELSFGSMIVGMLFVVITCIACLMQAQSDTYWHLRAGEDIWRTLSIPLTDTYSYTAAGREWPNHEWLWQAVSYGLYSTGGFPLLLLFGAAAIDAAFVMVYRLMVGPARHRFWLMLLSLPLSASIWALRPQIVTLALLALLLTLIARERYLWLPPLFVLWANFHGAVALGGVVLGAVTLAALIQARAPQPVARRRALALLMVTPLCALGTAATPMGFRLWQQIFATAARSNEARINEWIPSYPTKPFEIAFWIGAAAFLALLFARWRRLVSWSDAALVAAALALLPLAARAGRNIAPFMLIAVPAASRLLGANFRLSSTRDRPAEDPPRRLNSVLLGAFAVLGAGAVVTAWALPLPRLGWHPISPGALAAVRACPGPLYNQYDEGGYLIWLARTKPVFVDSRQDPYPRAFVLEAEAIESTGEYEAAFARFHITCAFLPARSPVGPRLQKAGWWASFSDEKWAVMQAPGVL